MHGLKFAPIAKAKIIDIDLGSEIRCHIRGGGKGRGRIGDQHPSFPRLGESSQEFLDEHLIRDDVQLDHLLLASVILDFGEGTKGPKPGIGKEYVYTKTFGLPQKDRDSLIGR